MSERTILPSSPAGYTVGATTVIDSVIFRNSFGTPGMRAIFSDRALMARCIEVEVALARAEAACGVIPAEAANLIARDARLERIDFERLGAETELVGFPIVPLLHQLVEMTGDAGRYIH